MGIRMIDYIDGDSYTILCKKLLHFQLKLPISGQTPTSTA